MLSDRVGLLEEPSGASGGWEQDKEHRRATEAGKFGETESAVEPDPKRGPDGIPMVRRAFGNRRQLGR